MQTATADGITIINFGMGSPNAATIMDLLTAIDTKCLFLGKCGGLRSDKNQVGDLILPIAAVRGEVHRTTICHRKCLLYHRLLYKKQFLRQFVIAI